MKRILLVFFLCLFFLSFARLVDATGSITLPVVSVVNPIRGQELGHEKDNLLIGLQHQWEVTESFHFPATWLWQYSALENRQLTEFAKRQMKRQEFGLFLEIDRNFAQKSGVQYRGQGPWYFSDGLFLTSYDVAERHRFIDTIFSQFHKVFGYYPTTVGAWWIDADSLLYMQQKYGITAAFHAADQYNLDVYTIWGTPWSIPYVTSKNNTGMPANSVEDSSHIVMLQWAPRDPLRGYGNSDKNGTYSLQDYDLKGYDTNYFHYLSSVFLKRPLDQIIVGIENSGAKYNFGPVSHYYSVLQQVSALQKQHMVTVLPVATYATAFLDANHVYAPTHYFLTKDYKTDNQSFWYNGITYRVGIEKNNSTISLVDYRNYMQKVPEDFSILPNSQGILRIDEPSLIDSATMPQEKKILLHSNSPLMLKKELSGVSLFSGNKEIATFTDTTQRIFIGNMRGAFAKTSQGLLFPTTWFFFFLFVDYIFFLLAKSKKKEELLLAKLIFVPFLLSLPFLSSGNIDQTTFLFDIKQLIFLLPFALIPFSSLAMFCITQVLPLMLLPLLHYFFIIRFPGKVKNAFYLGYLFFVSILFFHLPYFPLDRSTYKLVGMGIISIFLILCVFCFVIYRIYKRKKAVFIAIALSFFFLGLLLVALITSRTMLALAPFEMQSLSTVAQKREAVLYVPPDGNPIYKAVKPLLYFNYRFGSLLTHTKWTKATNDTKGNLVLPNNNSVVLFVPRYLGATIGEQSLEQKGWKKIFDNMQIALFER